jgi:hypothetical protein
MGNGDFEAAPSDNLAVPVVRMRAPVAAYGLMIRASRRRMPGVIFLAFLGLPIATDPDVLRATAILGTGLF